ncbi:class F sortase [Micromonospora inositola]|uniref:Sortase family protein n=1 Tax=Micromonospora inositola TaxID=47865 RepID=A0A1C5IN33_9ACTN|nr:class F sortase [Micromonospora inositola]SCG59553.1 Sortase family protein [Micromonospora inositola]
MARSRDRAGRPAGDWDKGRSTRRPGTRRTRRNRDDGRTRRSRDTGRAGEGFRASLRLVSRASRRFARAAAHAFSASVTTADPDARPVPVRPGAGHWRTVGQRGPGAPVLVIAALMVLIVAMLGVERVTGISVLPEQLSAGLRPPPKKFPVLPGSPPTDIAIGKIDLRAPVHQVGIAPDGSIDVPDVGKAGEAGWYDQGPTPGQYGPAVIVGHVDTTTGPAVFHNLKSLDDGDQVEVTRADRSVAVFEVTAVQRYGKDRLPVDEIFGDFSRPNLRLITCGGRWVGGETGYADNLVVYASLVKARGP